MKNIKPNGKSLDNSDLEKSNGGTTFIFEPEGNWLQKLFGKYVVCDENLKEHDTFYFFDSAYNYAYEREKSLGNHHPEECIWYPGKTKSEYEPEYRKYRKSE